MANRSVYLPRGKGLGGCSAINAMMYIRGHAADYDGWAALGCSGWGFEETMKFFARSETNERGGSDWHGDQGPLIVSNPRRIGPVALSFAESCMAAKGLIRKGSRLREQIRIAAFLLPKLIARR